MSLRQVLAIYNAERQLNEDDVALLNTLRKLNDNDRELLVQGLSDKPQKKSSKKVVGKSATKSTRASEMAAQLNKSLQGQRKAADDDEEFPDILGGHEPCAFLLDGQQCGAAADANIHLNTNDDYHHQFQPAEQAAATSGD